MKKLIFYFAFIASLFLIGAGPVTAGIEAPRFGQKTPGAKPEMQRICLSGSQASGAIYEICIPLLVPPWNGELIIYAHGYASPEVPLAIAEEFPDLSLAANLLGYGTATTSYSTNGLAVLPAIPDLLDLVQISEGIFGKPDRLYLVGPSMGGQITTLMIEQGIGNFDGGMALCAINGSFLQQTNYIGDFRVVFDYFFPGLLPGDPTVIPQSLMDDWDNHYTTVIEPVITDPANTGLVDQLLAVTGAAFDPLDPSTKIFTIKDILWFNVFGTNDGQEVLGGQPFDNINRVYSGSDDDVALNAGVARFAGDPKALAEIAANYETTGLLTIPFLTDHTTLDQGVPIWQSQLYAGKVSASGSQAFFTRHTTNRYGHCNFTALEILDDFLELVDMVNNPPGAEYRIFLPLAVRNP